MNKENGLLFRNEYQVDLANKIIEVLENKQNYCQITKKAFLKLEKEFSFDSFVKEQQIILQKIFS